MRHWTVHRSVLCDVLNMFPGTGFASVDFIKMVYDDVNEGVAVDEDGHIARHYGGLHDHAAYGTSGLCRQFVKLLLQEESGKVRRTSSRIGRAAWRRLCGLAMERDDRVYFCTAVNASRVLAFSGVFAADLLDRVKRFLPVLPHDVRKGTWKRA